MLERFFHRSINSHSSSFPPKRHSSVEKGKSIILNFSILWLKASEEFLFNHVFCAKVSQTAEIAIKMRRQKTGEDRKRETIEMETIKKNKHNKQLTSTIKLKGKHKLSSWKIFHIKCVRMCAGAFSSPLIKMLEICKNVKIEFRWWRPSSLL